MSLFKYKTIGFIQRKIENILLHIILAYVLCAQKNCLIETVLFEYPQHMFRLRNKEIIFLLRTLN